MKDLRELILNTLLEVEAGRCKSHLALNNLLDRHAELDKHSRAFLTRELEGVLERRLTLDAVISRFSKLPTKKLKSVILMLLRMGIYEFYFMDSVPPSATVNELVKLAEKKGFRSLKGFVNGVLRNADRNRIALSSLPPSERLSIPPFLFTLLSDAYGEEEAVRIAEAALSPAPLTVRGNRILLPSEELFLRLKKEGVCAEKCPELPNAYVLRELDRLSSLPAFREGLLFVQDLSSQRAMSVPRLHEGMRVLDLCAAPGGKSFFLYEQLNGRLSLTASDLTEEKTALLSENAGRLGFEKIRIEQQDARARRADHVEAFDLVVADLPCSGLGVMGRKKDLKYRITEADLKALSALQKEILGQAADYVAFGGELLYSTCTLNPGENRKNREWFLRERRDYRLVREETILPEKGRCDGFYYALLRREG